MPGSPPIATGRLFSAASPPTGSGASVRLASLSRYPGSGVLRGLVGPAQPHLPPPHPPQQLTVPSTKTHGGSSANAVSRTRHGDASGDPARAWGTDGTLGEAGTHGARMVRLGTPVPTWVGATPGAGCLGIPKRERISGGACLGIPRRERVSGEACLGIPGRERILGVPNGARPGRIKHLASKPVHAPALLSTRCAKPARVPGGLSTGAPSRARTPKGLGTPHQLRPWAPVLGRLRRPTGGATPVAKHREPAAIRGQARLGIPPLPSRRCQVPSIPSASCTARTTPPSPLAPSTSDATL